MTVDDEFVAGSYRVYLFEIVDSAYSPIDLAFAKNIEFTLRPYGEFDCYALFCKTLQNGIDITDSDRFYNNVAQVILDVEDTADLSEGKYVYQLTVTDGSGKSFTPQEGHLIIKKRTKIKL